MNITKAISHRSDFYERVINRIEGLKDGEGLTKRELAESFGFSSLAVIEKWMRVYPKLTDYVCYIQVNDGRNRTAIFVNKKYRKQLLDNKQATEIY
jgi:hypothetical protein